MTISAITSLITTTFVLVIVVVFAVMDFPFRWVFYLTVFGQVFLVYSVVKVLKDNYTTDKTFGDFYEDNPLGRE